jgi:hypothetical protein
MEAVLEVGEGVRLRNGDEISAEEDIVLGTAEEESEGDLEGGREFKSGAICVACRLYP